MKHISLTPFLVSRQPRARACSLSFPALVCGKWGEVKHKSMEIPVRLEALEDGGNWGNRERMERDRPNLEVHSMFSSGKDLG